MVPWIVLQLADAAFPTGGFAHSGGLEALIAARELGGPGGLEAYCRELIDQQAHGALPLVGAAWDAPDRLAELDARSRALLWSHVAARASRAQGRVMTSAPWKETIEGFFHARISGRRCTAMWPK